MIDMKEREKKNTTKIHPLKFWLNTNLSHITIPRARVITIRYHVQVQVQKREGGVSLRERESFFYQYLGINHFQED